MLNSICVHITLSQKEITEFAFKKSREVYLLCDKIFFATFSMALTARHIATFIAYRDKLNRPSREIDL